MTITTLPSYNRANAWQGAKDECMQSNSGKYWIVIFLILLNSSLSATGATFKQDWLSSTWTPCEGVGMSGSARYYYEADQNLVSPAGRMDITSIAVFGSSAAFMASDVFLIASVSVVKNGSTMDTVKLVHPEDSVVEPAPGPTETRRLYLPHGKSLSVPTGATLLVAVSTVKNNCSINNSTHTIDPFAANH